MPKITLFISKAGVSKLDGSQIFFFLFLVIVFLEVEKDVKDKAGVKINSSLGMTHQQPIRGSVSEHDQGVGPGHGYENSLQSRRKQYF